MQKLEIYQSLWGMEQRTPGIAEAPPEEHFARIAEAGYHGVCLDPAIHEIDDSLALAPLFQQHQLGCMVNAFPDKVSELKPLLEMSSELNACAVNVISGVMPITVAGALPVLYRWMDEAQQLDIPLLIETHRDGILNDLYYTLQVLDALPELRLCADLSHFVIDREFRVPLSDRDQGFITRVLERSDCFQGRVANREQVQIQIGFPQHQEWVEIFKSWWKQGMRLWRARNAEDATLRFLCELGPPSYAITDANGHELSDRWQEALTIRGWVEQIWAELEAEESGAAA
jgi:hypothetical protein